MSTLSISSTSSNLLISSVKRIKRRSGLILDHIYQSKEWADCDIKLVSKVFPVHRAVVFTAIPYLKSVYLEQIQEKSVFIQSNLTLTINYPLLDLDAFEWLIKWSYSISVTITWDNVRSLLIATDYLQVTNVFNYCLDYLNEIISIENVLTIKEWISSYNISTNFRDKVNCFICEQFIPIVETSSYLGCGFEQLVEIIDDPKLEVDNEIEIFMAIMKWIKYDQPNRQQLVPKLLIHLRWCSLSYEQIINQIGKEELISANIDCRNLIIEVLSCLTFDSIVSQHSKYQSVWRQPRNNQLFNQQLTNHDHCIAIGLNSSAQLELRILDYCNNLLAPWLRIDHLKVTRETHRAARLGHYLFLIARNCFAINLISGKTNDRIPSELQTFDWPDCVSDDGGNRIYVSGGLNGGPSDIVYSVRRDDSEDEWKVNQLRSLNVPRAGHRLAYCTGSLFAFGGRDKAKAPIDSVERYDQILDKWSIVSPMFTPRSGHGLAVHREVIYVVGGYDGADFLTDFESYNPKDDTWRPLSPLIVKGKIISLIVANQQSLMVLIRSPNKLIQIYSLQSNSWSLIESDCLVDQLLISVTLIPSELINRNGSEQSSQSINCD